MKNPTESGVEMSNRSQGFGKAPASVLWVGLILIAVIGAACGDASGGGGGGKTLCSDFCADVRDGVCDDGGPGSAYFVCEYGADCSDCGPRDPRDAPNCCLRWRFFEDETACMAGLKDCPPAFE